MVFLAILMICLLQKKEKVFFNGDFVSSIRAKLLMPGKLQFFTKKKNSDRAQMHGNLFFGYYFDDLFAAKEGFFSAIII